MSGTTADGRLELLRGLYGDEAETIEARAMARLGREHAHRSPDPSESDAWLIAYPDQFIQPDEAPLVTLRRVLDRYFGPEVTGVHVLPFHPSSSDRGFSVIDYDLVDDEFGSWDDITSLASERRVMADAVVNHMSAEGRWFRAFLAGERPYDGYFRGVDPSADLSAVVRPRTLPLVTRFDGAGGPVHVWTTFSADQVDLDYRSSDVLLVVLEVLLRYRRAGVSAIRLDAIAFIWKVEGTTSINLPGTHDVIEVLRSWLDEVDPGLMVVTETNVPHDENIAYLGRAGRREAQAVYQFALPPLLLHTLATGDPTVLVDWAAGLDEPGAGRTFLNFTSSHDGVGIRPVEGLLDVDAIGDLTTMCERAGGVVNSRRLADGSTAPYELASTWYALMTAIDPDPERALARHLLSQAFVLALKGIPLLYTHVLLASDNDVDGYRRTGIARDLNRADIRRSCLDEMFADPGSRASRSTREIRRLLRVRSTSETFHPDATQRVYRSGQVVAVERVAASGIAARVYLNVGTDAADVPLDERRWASLDPDAAEQDMTMIVRVPALGSAWIRTLP